MGEQMGFPETFEKFVKEYGFKDDKEIYTNGSELIPIFRVKQWLEHDNKLRTIETDTAYECDKHAKIGHCKDCKFCEYASVTNLDGIPLMVSRELKICLRWGDGCKTKEDGFCFMFEPKESEVEK